MKIFLFHDYAFVDFDKGYMLCIGTKADVDQASEAKIGQMVLEAVATSKYLTIQADKRVH